MIATPNSAGGRLRPGALLLLSFSALVLSAFVSGCASSPGVIPTPTAGLSENPTEGVAIQIVEIVDERQFGETAGSRLVPTLTGDRDDPGRRSRAIGRSNTPTGTPGPVIFLEPGLTIESTTRDALARAFRGAGFRVLGEGDAGLERAIPVEVGIEQYWMMKNPPNASPFVLGEIRARVRGPLPGLETGQVIESRGKVVRGGYTRGMWRQALDKTLDDLTLRTQDALDGVRLAIEATPTSQLLPQGLATLDLPKRPNGHDVDYGKYYLLAIGIDEYEVLPRLKTAISDARAVSGLLEAAYGFETELLENATRQDVIRALSAYREKVGPRDNLLIYYAGHGWNDEEADLGYWLPADAHPDDETNWVSNAKITSILRAMDAKHVMVVSDSCYSGTLTRGISVTRTGPSHVERLSARRTRLALTSGGNEPVVDGGGGGHPVFANAFLRTLRENEAVLDATTLHARIREPIMRDSDQTPQFGPIRSARHEDGDFLFVRKD